MHYLQSNSEITEPYNLWLNQKKILFQQMMKVSTITIFSSSENDYLFERQIEIFGTLHVFEHSLQLACKSCPAFCK